MDPQETRIYLAVIITGLVIGIIIIYFAISVIRQQRKNIELQKQNALAEISAMEKERARIAADLHDELGPVLSVVKFRIDNVEPSDASEKEELNKASEQLDQLIAKLREVANNLMPTALLRKGLAGALREFVTQVSQAGLTHVQFSGNTDINISEEKSINIFRVIQEIVHNCLKHANAENMEIIFAEKNNQLQVLCRDNGNGFDYERMLEEATGMGLRSIRNRIQIMGGNLVAESIKGKGSAFKFDIPLQ